MARSRGLASSQDFAVGFAGGELGEAWHRAGNLGNKERVFEDFEAVIGWLGGESGISSPAHIGIQGGSNGGLLMGAMITRVPERFRVALAGVGLYDMVRYHRFPPAELWISEYGSADENAEQLGWLHAYSPYHRVRDGMTMPAVLITTADHDTRVHWAHSTKFAARLQEASGEADPSVYFFMDRHVGHGAGTRRSDIVQRYVRLYTFLEHHVGRPRRVAHDVAALPGQIDAQDVAVGLVDQLGRAGQPRVAVLAVDLVDARAELALVRAPRARVLQLERD